MFTLKDIKGAWRDIPGYEGMYIACEDGRIRSLKRKYAVELKGCLSNGYKQVFLCKNGTSKAFKIHNIIARVFIGEKRSGMTVNHKDTNKLNNSASNLEYITNLENVRHGFANGLMSVGSKNNLSKLVEDQVIGIRHLGELGYKPIDIARHFRISYQNVWLILKRKSWRHVK